MSSDERLDVVAGGCFIVSFGAKFHFLIMGSRSPPHVFLGEADVVASTKDSVEAVVDAARDFTKDRVSLKTSFDLEVWEVGWFQSQNLV